MNHTEAAQYIKATLTAFGPGEAISMTKETWAKIHEAMQVLAQPEQEPFAYLDPGLGAFYWAREYPDGPPPGFEPVYLAGSNKRWVGLTDAEIEEFDYDFRDLVMDIEKLLMERNS